MQRWFIPLLLAFLLVGGAFAAEKVIPNNAKIYIEKMDEGLDGYIRAEFVKKSVPLQIVTQAVLDQRIAGFRTAQSQVAAAKGALAVAEAEKSSRVAERRELMVRIDRTEVKAPVAGIVSRRTARLGAVAMSGGDAPAKFWSFRPNSTIVSFVPGGIFRSRVPTAPRAVLPGIP